MPIIDSNGPLPSQSPVVPPTEPAGTPRSRLIVEVSILVVLLLALGFVIYIKFIA